MTAHPTRAAHRYQRDDLCTGPDVGAVGAAREETRRDETGAATTVGWNGGFFSAH